MTTPRKTRGEYRPIYEALFHGKDYRVLSPEAKLLLLTLKGLCGAKGIAVWPALVPMLSELTGLQASAVTPALEELERRQWIEHEDRIVWVVRGLEFEPQVSPTNRKHKAWIERDLRALPRAPIVDRFRRRYAEFLFGGDSEQPSDTPPDSLSHSLSHSLPHSLSDSLSDSLSHRLSNRPDSAETSAFPAKNSPELGTDRVSDRLSDRVSHRLSDTLCDTTTPTPTPTPTTFPNPLPPTTDPGGDGELVQSASGSHRQSLVIRANQGIATQFGEQPNPLQWAAKKTFEFADALEAAGVPLAFAEQRVFDVASSQQPSDGRPPKAMTYFTAAVVDAWEAEQVQRRVRATPPLATAAERLGREREAAHTRVLIQYAQQGDADAIAECERMGLEFRSLA
ncbi:hypothetical protein [Gemmatimonas sp.]